jgi:PBP1b-binding outer membrane lipoprotein LpoB
MKKSMGLILLVTMILMVSACTQELTNIEKAQTAAENYLGIIYTLEDYTIYIEEKMDYEKITKSRFEYYEKLSPYITKNMEKRMDMNRETNLIVSSAAKERMNLKLIDVQFDQIDEDGDKIFMNYQAQIQLDYYDGRTETVIKEGKLQLVNQDGQWKVNHYLAVNYPFERMDM